MLTTNVMGHFFYSLLLKGDTAIFTVLISFLTIILIHFKSITENKFATVFPPAARNYIGISPVPGAILPGSTAIGYSATPF